MVFRSRGYRKGGRRSYRRSSYKRRSFKRRPRFFNKFRPASRSSGSELKYADFNIGTLEASQTVKNTFIYTKPDAGSTNAILLTVGGGSLVTQRVGNQAIIKEVTVRGQICTTDSTTKQPCYRMMLFVDKNCSGTAPTVLDLLDVPYGTNAIFAPRNLNYRERFVMLRDIRGATAPVGNTATCVPFEFDVKLNLKQTYTGPESAVANCTAGAIYFVCLGEDSTGYSKICCTIRMRFTDP